MSLRQLEAILDLLERGECPRESKPALTRILQSGDAEIKLRALEFTLELIDEDRFADLHVDLVESPDEPTDVRARAAVTLGPTFEICDLGGWGSEWDPPPISESCFADIQRRFERVYRTAEAPKLVRRRVLEASVRAARDWHYGAVRAAWNGDDPEWRQTAVLAMGHLAGFDEQLDEAIEAEHERIVCEALRAASGLETLPGGPETYLAFARDPDRPLTCRLAAIEGLRFVDSPEAVNLLETLTDAPSDEIAGTAAWALDEWYVYNSGG